MPATAGRVRMPANNRLSVSDSLRTSEIWQKSVGYDPYAPDAVGGSDDPASNAAGGINDKAKGLFALARLTGSSSAVTPGGCPKCGQIGHLSFQCRNLLSATKKASVGSSGRLKGIPEKNEADEEEDEELDEQAKKKLFGVETDSSSSSSSDDSDSSESSASSKSSKDAKRRKKRKSTSSHRSKTKSSNNKKSSKSSKTKSSSSRPSQPAKKKTRR
eukprot:GHVS01095844.1.p1 GENE.GHVS01095844.1~~GHVS01095844.1.p1  ORF type:complete len:216 (-),score=47.38 GHVS01095844.1:442-1089(-)